MDSRAGCAAWTFDERTSQAAPLWLAIPHPTVTPYECFITSNVAYQDVICCAMFVAGSALDQEQLDMLACFAWLPDLSLYRGNGRRRPGHSGWRPWRTPLGMVKPRRPADLRASTRSRRRSGSRRSCWSWPPGLTLASASTAPPRTLSSCPARPAGKDASSVALCGSSVIYPGREIRDPRRSGHRHRVLAASGTAHCGPSSNGYRPVGRGRSVVGSPDHSGWPRNHCVGGRTWSRASG